MIGKLEVVCGPMFAGKTEELIRRVKRCTLAHQQVQVFKPHIDSRYGLETVMSHSKSDLESITKIRPRVVDHRQRFDARLMIRDETSVVAFDEVQFFETEWITEIVLGLVKDGLRVICAGLDLNTYGEPFGCMPTLVTLADEVTKLKAVCMNCHQDANRTYRATPFQQDVAIEIGGMGLYEPRCLGCWEPTPRT